MLDQPTPQLASRLVESDAQYFAAGAASRPFPGGVVRWIPGLQHLAAGCIVEADGSASCAVEFLEAAGDAVAAVGAPLLRFYSAGLGELWETELAEEGLLSAVELAFARRPEPFFPAVGGALPVRAVTGPADWARKEKLARAAADLPDGKVATAREWTRLERAKAAAGYATFFIVEVDGTACGAFALAECGPLLRLKNLLVHSAFRNRGVGRAAVDYALRHASANGFQWVGAFGLEGGAGSRLYTRCGFDLVGSQTEWTRPALRAVVPLAASLTLESVQC